MIRVINVISDTNIGGAGKILLSFLKNYDPSRFQIEVVLPRGSQLIPPLLELKIAYTEIDAMADRSFDRQDVGKLLALFQEKKPQIVHTHAAMSARVAAKIYGKCGVVATRHSVFDQPAYKKRFPVKQINGFLNNYLSDLILAVSPAAKENIVEVGTDPKKVRVVFNGIDAQIRLSHEEKKQVRQICGLSENDFVCAIIARLEKVKGHDYLIEAARELLGEDPGIKILIAGTGSCEESLRKQAEHLPNVIFTGFVSDIHNIENIMDLQINASWGTEATSLSLLEGMSLGIPAVVSDFGGNPYVIEEGVNGLVVEKKSAAALKKAIITMKEDKEAYQKMAAGSADIFLKKFTSQAMTREIEQVYEFCAQQKRG